MCPKSLLNANDDYYRALDARDLDALAQLWGMSGLSCIHPGWPALYSRQEILVSYRELLSGAGRARVARKRLARDVRASEVNGLGRVVCTEKIDGSYFLCTNLFARSEGTWRLIHHQAGPAYYLALADARAVAPSVH